MEGTSASMGERMFGECGTGARGSRAEITRLRSCCIATGEWPVVTALFLDCRKACLYTDLSSLLQNQADYKNESLHLLN